VTTAFRPGVLVTSRADPPSRGISSDSSTWFVVGAAQKGPTTYAKLIRSMTEFTTHFGTRQTYSVLWDALETYFREGGSQAQVARVSGASDAIASRTLLDTGGGNSLKVSAKNSGLWGNGLLVQVVIPVSGTFQLVITDSTGVRDTSPYFTDQTSAINWSRNSDWVNVSFPSSPTALIPVALSASALSGGLDDVAGISDSQRQAALAFFTADLGPGQVSIPGNLTGANRTALIAHARLYNREAILDATDSGSRSAGVTEAQGLQGDEYGALFGPWVVIPGLIPNTTRIVPPSALVAALMARSDASNSPNVPAAVSNGQANYALDVSQVAWSDSDRDLLNSAGYNVIRNVGGQVEVYGYRTLISPNGDTSWLDLGNQRLRELITWEAKQIAEGFVLQQLDGKGKTVAEFNGALAGMLAQHYAQGSLVGDSPDLAFRVDTGSSVNTPQTLANNELHAVITLRMAGMAELVAIEIVKISSAQSI